VAQRLGVKGIKTTADELQLLMGPIEDLYALADHAKCLSFMLGDGIGEQRQGGLPVPPHHPARHPTHASLKLQVPLRELVQKQLEILRPEFPGTGPRGTHHRRDFGPGREPVARNDRQGHPRHPIPHQRGRRSASRNSSTLRQPGPAAASGSQVAEPLGVKVEIPDAST